MICKDKLEEIRQKALAGIAESDTPYKLNEVRVAILGKMESLPKFSSQ